MRKPSEEKIKEALIVCESYDVLKDGVNRFGTMGQTLAAAYRSEREYAQEIHDRFEKLNDRLTAEIKKRAKTFEKLRQAEEHLASEQEVSQKHCADAVKLAKEVERLNKVFDETTQEQIDFADSLKKENERLSESVGELNNTVEAMISTESALRLRLEKALKVVEAARSAESAARSAEYDLYAKELIRLLELAK
jgi:hypothetical protein